MPDLPGKPQHDPACMDETMMMVATFAGKQPNIDRVGVAYMLLGESGADQNDISVVLPDTDKPALQGINQDISKNEPYVTALRSSSPLWVIPIAKAGERIVIQPSKSTR